MLDFSDDYAGLEVCPALTFISGPENAPKPISFQADCGAFLFAPLPLNQYLCPGRKKGAYFEKLNHLSKLPSDLLLSLHLKWEKPGKSLRAKEYGADTEKRNE